MSRLLVCESNFATQLGESFEMDTIFLLFSTECGARKAAVSFGIARSLDGDFGECIWEADSTRGTLGVLLLLCCNGVVLNNVACCGVVSCVRFEVYCLLAVRVNLCGMCMPSFGRALRDTVVGMPWLCWLLVK